MRGTVKGIIEGLNQILVEIPDLHVERGDIVEIDVPADKRSNNANKFYWKMNAKLAKALNTSAEALYKHQIRDMSVYDCMLIQTAKVEAFTKRWTSKHLGRFVETRESQQEGMTIVLAYYGSSDFTRHEMWVLMENLKQDLKLMGISYDTEEINRLIAIWNGGD